MKTYEETIELLYTQLPVFQKEGATAYKEGLDNSYALDQYFSHPHRSFQTIHVGGTNGKGSTSHLIAAILQESGYKVGLYTSPHLVDFRERIRVNGRKIQKEFVVDFVDQHFDHIKSIQPSFFELTMMMAFDYFRARFVDVAIIEVGLGGRLDSTNIITPDLCIITNISFDHVQFLGNTLTKIASEKAGIIKPGVPVVIGEAETDVKAVFTEKAEKENAPIFFAEESKLIKSVSMQNHGAWMFDTKYYPELIGELGGYCQIKNAQTVLTAIEQLKESGYTITPEAVYYGFAHVTHLTGLQGRWQLLQENPRVICDTGHNKAGIQYIVDQLGKQEYKKLHIVIGMVNDKDISGILELLPKDAQYYFTRAAIPRALDQNVLMKLATDYNLKGNAFPTVDQAYCAAMQAIDSEDLLFIGGSSFVVADLLTCLQNR